MCETNLYTHTQMFLYENLFLLPFFPFVKTIMGLAYTIQYNIYF